MDLNLEDVFRKKKATLKIVFSGLVVPMLNHSFNFQKKDFMVNYQDFLEQNKKKEKRKKIRAVIKEISVTEFSFFSCFVQFWSKDTIPDPLSKGKRVQRWKMTKTLKWGPRNRVYLAKHSLLRALSTVILQWCLDQRWLTWESWPLRNWTQNGRHPYLPSEEKAQTSLSFSEGSELKHSPCFRDSWIIPYVSSSLHGSKFMWFLIPNVNIAIIATYELCFEDSWNFVLNYLA